MQTPQAGESGARQRHSGALDAPVDEVLLGMRLGGRNAGAGTMAASPDRFEVGRPHKFPTCAYIWVTSSLHYPWSYIKARECRFIASRELKCQDYGYTFLVREIRIASMYPYS